MRNVRLVSMALLAALFVGCGQSHDARKTVKEFMASQMGIADYDVIEWGGLDSTFFVSDSMVQVMRHSTPQKVKAQYVKYSPKLLYLNVKYAVGSDTVRQTFYLDDKLTGVVAYKQN